MYTHIYAHCLLAYACMRVPLPNVFWCILDTSYIFIPRFIKIRPHLAEKWGLIFFPKLRACFHALCVHTLTCMHKNNFDQLRRPIVKYAESLVNFSEVEYCAQPKGWVRLGLTLLDLTWFYMTWCAFTCLDLTWINIPWPGLDCWPDLTWLDMT